MTVERYFGRGGEERMRCSRCGCEAMLAPDGLFHCSSPPRWCASYALPGREQVVSSAIPAVAWKVREEDVERAAIQEEG